MLLASASSLRFCWPMANRKLELVSQRHHTFASLNDCGCQNHDQRRRALTRLSHMFILLKSDFQAWLCPARELWETPGRSFQSSMHRVRGNVGGPRSGMLIVITDGLIVKCAPCSQRLKREINAANIKWKYLYRLCFSHSEVLMWTDTPQRLFYHLSTVVALTHCKMHSHPLSPIWKGWRSLESADQLSSATSGLFVGVFITATAL